MLPIADDDECILGTHDCDPRATCTNIAGGWTCNCNTGYSGTGQACTGTVEAVLAGCDYSICSSCLG